MSVSRTITPRSLGLGTKGLAILPPQLDDFIEDRIIRESAGGLDPPPTLQHGVLIELGAKVFHSLLQRLQTPGKLCI